MSETPQQPSTDDPPTMLVGGEIRSVPRGTPLGRLAGTPVCEQARSRAARIAMVDFFGTEGVRALAQPRVRI